MIAETPRHVTIPFHVKAFYNYTGRLTASFLRRSYSGKLTMGNRPDSVESRDIPYFNLSSEMWSYFPNL